MVNWWDAVGTAGQTGSDWYGANYGNYGDNTYPRGNYAQTGWGDYSGDQFVGPPSSAAGGGTQGTGRDWTPWIQGGTALIGAGLGYLNARDQQKYADKMAQPTNQYGYSGINLGGAQPFFDYFLNEIPSVYQHMQSQGGGRGVRIPRGRNVEGPGSLSTGLAGDMAAYARAQDPAMGAASNWMTGLMNGQAPNPAMAAALQNAGAGGGFGSFIGDAQGIMNDPAYTGNPYVQQLIGSGNGLIGDLFGMIPGMMQGGGGGGGSFISGGGGGGGFQGAGAGRGETMLLDFAQPLLEDPMGNPMYTQLADMQERQATDAYNKAFANAVGSAASAGRYGSGAYNALQAANAGQLGQGISDAQTNAMMALLNAGLTGATQGGQLETSRLNTNTNASAQAASAAAAAGASRYGADAARQAQMFSSLLGLTGDVYGANMGLAGSMYGDDQNARAMMGNLGLQGLLGQQDALGSLGADWGALQAGAAGLLPEYNRIPMQNLMDAFGASTSLDQMRQQAAQANNSHQMQIARMQQAQANANRNAPWDNLNNAMRLMMPFADLYGTQWNQAQMPGQNIPTTSPWAGALGGAMWGYGAGDQLTGG